MLFPRLETSLIYVEEAMAERPRDGLAQEKFWTSLRRVDRNLKLSWSIEDLKLGGGKRNDEM